MKIVIAGGTGFLGLALADALAAEHHDVVVLTRQAAKARVAKGVRAVEWIPNGQTGFWAAEVDGAGAVVNLAGESIAAKRWTAAHKRRVLDSRVLATRSLVEAILASTSTPQVFVSGSAVGYYGPRGDEIVTEVARAGDDFLAGVCVQWEAEAARAGSRTRVACIRTGLPLERDGGALPKMLPPFWIGAGGPLGSGRQYWPWIHRQDWVDLVRWTIRTAAATGALNATSPNPVTNAEFARRLGHAIHRPAFLPTPAFALRVILGELADALLLTGQRVVPARAQELGFRFTYPGLDDALRAIF